MVDRPPEIAGSGKGAALNEGYTVLREMLERGDRLVEGWDPDEIVVGIIDADGDDRAGRARRDRSALRRPAGWWRPDGRDHR